MRRLSVVFVALLVLAGPCALAQHRLVAGLGASVMMANNFNMPEYNQSTMDVELGWFYRTDGSQEWQRLRKKPSFGLKASFGYIPQGIAGHRFGLVGMVKAPLWKRLEYGIGLGISTYTKPYCLTHDPENIFISSIISCLIDVELGFRITDGLSITAAMLHTSNGNLYLPNKGFNFFRLGLEGGLCVGSRSKSSLEPGYSLRETAIQEDKSQYIASRGDQEIGFTLSNGLVMSRHLMQKGYFPCYDLSLNYLYYTSPVVAVGGTVDLWYNFSHSWQLPRYNDKYPIPMYLNVQGVCEGFWGPLSVRISVGGVLLASSRVGMRLYERVGTYYNFGKSYVGVGLHARAGMIEFVELSYGYRIPLGKK